MASAPSVSNTFNQLVSSYTDAFTLDYSQNYQTNLTYPEDLISNQSNRNFYMSFRFEKYEKTSITDTTPTRTALGSVKLPIPSSLRESVDTSYDQTNLGLAIGAGLQSLVKNKSNFNNIKNGTLSLVNAGTAAAAGAVTNIGTSLVGSNVTDAASAFTGVTTNPFQTVLFRHPNFKTFTFSWLFTPQSSNESELVKNIINTFKYHQAPGLDVNGFGLFFEFPSILRVSLFPSDVYLFPFKRCIITNFSADYAPGNSPSFFKSKTAPTAVKIDISLTEVELWTKNDYLAQTTSTAPTVTPIQQNNAEISSQQLSPLPGYPVENYNSSTPSLPFNG